MDNPKVLIVEDDTDVNHLIVKSLNSENIDCDSAYDGVEADEALKTKDFDLVILDLMIPHINGLELLGRLRKNIQVPVIILSAKGEETDKVIGLGLGADDYMTKPFSLNELKARVKAHLRRHLQTQYDLLNTVSGKAQIIRQGEIELNLHTYQCIINGEIHDLKAKEFELLKLFLMNPNRVFTKSQLYEQVWKENYMEDENTVMVHIRRIRKKIEKEPSNPKYIQTVWGIGYKLGNLS